MGAFLLRRLVSAIPVLLLVSAFTFSLLLLVPGDPVLSIMGVRERGAVIDPEVYDRLHKQLGFDRPVPLQYVSWLGNVLQGDLGESLRTRQDVTDMVVQRLPRTLELGLVSLLLAILIGVPAGILAAIRPNSALDTVATLFAMSGVAFPSFWLGILLIHVFTLWLDWLPPSGYVPFTEDPVRHFKLLLMPAFTVAVGPAAVLMRQVRGALAEVMGHDYVTAARSKGLHERQVIGRHGLRNALIPIVTIAGMQIGNLFGGAVVAETIFSIPGTGLLLVDAISYRDFPTVQGVVLLLAVAVLAGNLLADVLYGYVDPRVRYG